jgi:peptidoglycan/xylan/chitin deacetylase (PgdA/CDA1 family)
MTAANAPLVRHVTLRDRVIRSGKRAVAQAMHATGILAVRRRRALRQRAVVLAYHRLLPPGADTWSHPGIIVTPETFERHMRLLRQEFRVLSLQEFEDHLSTSTPFEPGSCLVTFDDGWLDTYTEAWPILQRWQVPAVVFLPTHFIGSQETFWQEHLGMLLYKAGKALTEDPTLRAPLAETLRSCGLEHLIGDLADRSAIIDRVRTLKLDAMVAPSDAAARLVALLGHRAPRPGDLFMTWDHVREMARGELAFGAHGHSHRILSRLTEDEVSMELATSRAIIERETGMPVTSVSYPNGGWTDRVAACVRTLRFRAGFSMERGHAAATDPYFAIRRMNIHEGLSGSDALFRARLLGVF